MNHVLLYLGAGLPLLWGVAHLVPTRSVVSGFGAISEDNRRIITMEWIIEGVALIFLGVLVAVVTRIDPQSAIARAVQVSSAAMLLVLAVISAFTGFRIAFLPFRICPFLFTTSALLILAGALL
ncbi:MAG: hypothetical protein OXU20_28345 [Myxococcales bacterium]|nr:hypothetical protein [Myxococcales bacterium]